MIIVYNWGTFLIFSCCFLSSLQICVFDLRVRGNTLPTVVYVLTMFVDIIGSIFGGYFKQVA